MSVLKAFIKISVSAVAGLSMCAVLLHFVDKPDFVDNPAKIAETSTGKAALRPVQPCVWRNAEIVGGAFRSNDEGIIRTRINADQHQYGWIGQVITGDPRIYGRVHLGTNGRGIPFADLKR